MVRNASHRDVTSSTDRKMLSVESIFFHILTESVHTSVLQARSSGRKSEEASFADTRRENLDMSRKFGKLFFGEHLSGSGGGATEDVVELGRTLTRVLECIGALRRRRRRGRNEGSEEAARDFGNGLVILYIDSERSRRGGGAKLRAAT